MKRSAHSADWPGPRLRRRPDRAGGRARRERRVPLPVELGDRRRGALRDQVGHGSTPTPRPVRPASASASCFRPSFGVMAPAQTCERISLSIEVHAAVFFDTG